MDDERIDEIVRLLSARRGLLTEGNPEVEHIKALMELNGHIVTDEEVMSELQRYDVEKNKPALNAKLDMVYILDSEIYHERGFGFGSFDLPDFVDNASNLREIVNAFFPIHEDSWKAEDYSYQKTYYSEKGGSYKYLNRTFYSKDDMTGVRTADHYKAVVILSGKKVNAEISHLAFSHHDFRNYSSLLLTMMPFIFGHSTLVTMMGVIPQSLMGTYWFNSRKSNIGIKMKIRPTDTTYTQADCDAARNMMARLRGYRLVSH